MKSLTRTIIMLIVLNLTMGNLAPAQTEGQAEGSAKPTDSRLARRPEPPETTQPGPAPPVPTPPVSTPEAPVPPEPPMRTFKISGRTGLSGVEMQGLPGNPVTANDGTYKATVPYGFSGRVVPVKEDYIFEPPQLTYTNVIDDQTNQNYSAKKITFIISGRIGLIPVVSQGVSGVLMRGLPGNPVTTDENGNYSATVEYGWRGTVTPTKKGFTFEPPNRLYSKVIRDQKKQSYSSRRVGPGPMLGRTGGRKVLVIPDSEVKPEELDAITQDLLVMSHILDEKFKEPRTIKGVFTDFGDFFGRDNRATEAIYMQGYGVVFLMEVNFAFSPPLKPQEQEDEEAAEQIDPTWQRARQQIFSPRAPRPRMSGFSGQGPSLVEFDQLKKELIETLKHAANIRNLTPDEWVIVTVIGQGRQGGVMYFSNEPLGAAAPRSNYSSSYSASEHSASSEGGGYAASSSSGIAGGGMGGYGGGMMGGYGGGMMGGYGDYGGGMGGYGGGMMGGMGGYGGGMGGYGGGMGGMAGMGMGMGMGGMYGEMDFPSTTILTIRAKKTDVSDFARDELDFDQFQEMVEIFTY